MNEVRRRVDAKTAEEKAAVQRIEENQTAVRIREVYQKLKDNPKLEWKDSFKEIVGLPAA